MMRYAKNNTSIEPAEVLTGDFGVRTDFAPEGLMQDKFTEREIK